MTKYKFNDEEVAGALAQAEIDAEYEDESRPEPKMPSGYELGEFIQIQRLAFSKQNIYYGKVISPLRMVSEMDRKDKQMKNKYLLRIELIDDNGLTGEQKDLLSITAMTGCFDSMETEEYLGKCYKFHATKHKIAGKDHKGFELRELTLKEKP